MKNIKLNTGEKGFTQSNLHEIEFEGEMLSTLITFYKGYGTCWEIYATSDEKILVWYKNFLIWCEEVGVSTIEVYNSIAEVKGNVPDELINSII